MSDPNADGPKFRTVEIGFPSSAIEEILPYAQDPGSPTDTVYGYVPIELVEKIVEDHGGIKGVWFLNEVHPVGIGIMLWKQYAKEIRRFYDNVKTR